jgi:hypothetical protein
MNDPNINDFSDKFPPYGGEKEYAAILNEYFKVFGEKINLPYSPENYGKVYDSISIGKPLTGDTTNTDKIAARIVGLSFR